jgi:hypothetical protein
MSYTFDRTEDPRARRRRRIAEAMMQQGSDYSPIASPWQGAARIANGLIGGYMSGQEDKRDTEREAEMTGLVSKAQAAVNGGSVPSVSPAAAALSGGTPNYRDAISSIESGGKYDITGPVTKSGDRAYGRYQVMGNNIGPWTREILGKEMTPEEFLRTPEAQDKVFDHRFGGYVKQYGNPQDAASMWFSGRPMAKAGNAKDVLGTTVPGYVSKFTKALTGGQPTQIAQGQSQDVMPGGPTTITDTVQPGGMMGMGAPPPKLPEEIAVLIARGHPLGKVLEKQWEQNTPQARAQRAMDEEKRRLEMRVLEQRAARSNDPTAVQEYERARRDPEFAAYLKERDKAKGTTIKNEGAIPPGYRAKRDAEGNVTELEPIPGSKEAKAIEEQDKVKKRNADTNLATIGDIEKKVGGGFWTTGLVGSMLQNRPGTDANDVRNSVDTLKANISLDKLQELRKASPTGAGLGSVSNAEGDRLSKSIASLEQSQSAEQFKANLQRVKDAYLDAIHGAGNRPGQSPYEETKDVGGKKYGKVNGKWFEVTP